MLKVLLLITMLFAGIVLIPLVVDHQDYVLIQTANYNIETSVTCLIIILILVFIILFMIKMAIRRLCLFGEYTRLWFHNHKNYRAHKQKLSRP